MIAVVAVAVVALTQQYQVFAALGSVLGGAATAVTASVVSQGYGVAIGAQDKFSFKGVALAALSGGIGAGINTGGLFGGGVANAIGRGVATNALTQGIGLATGLQSKFDFAGVAAAGAVHGIGAFASSGLPGAATATRAASTGNVIASSAAGAIAGAATRSALTGESFGDNLMRAMPDVIANSLILAGGAVLAQRGGNDGGGGGGSHVQRTSVGPIAYLDQPESNGVLTMSGGYGDFDAENPITVTAQMGRNMMGIADWVVGIIGGSNPFATSALDSVSGRIAMSLTNPKASGEYPSVTNGRANGQGYWSGSFDRAHAYHVAARENYRLTTMISPTGSIGSIPAGINYLTAAFKGHVSHFIENKILPAEYQDYYTLKSADFANRKSPWPFQDGHVFTPQSKADLIADGVIMLATGRIGTGGSVAAAEGNFIGPLIGKSGFRTSSELAEAVGARYQGFVDGAYVAAQRSEARGLLIGNPNTRLGAEVDRISAARLEAYLQSEGIKEGPGRLVQMNRWLRDPTGSGLYVRPDVHIPAAGRIFDATVGFKPYNTPQVMRFGQYSRGGHVTLIRPGAVGGSYSVIP